jgi:hypothetical protein
MEKIIMIVALFSFLLIGFIYFLKNIYTTKKICSAITQYTIILTNYYNSHGINQQEYIQLMKNANIIQCYLGTQGYARVQMPFEHDTPINHYSIIRDGVPQLQAYLTTGLNTQASQMANYISGTLYSRIGSYENELSIYKNNIKNPIKLIVTGIQRVILIPMYILSWLGLFSNKTINRIGATFIFKLLSGIVALIGLISSIMTIILGWDDFLRYIYKLLFSQ